MKTSKKPRVRAASARISTTAFTWFPSSCLPCAANHVSPKAVSEQAMQALQSYRWPGNVRELENAVQRIVLMTDSHEVDLGDLPRDVVQSVSRDSRGRFRLPPSGFDLQAELDA